MTRRGKCSRRNATWLWWSALALAAWGAPARAEVPISEQARLHFNAGVRYLTTREPERFEQAYSEFRAAYADSPSWKILGNLGIVAEALERDGEAIQAYRGYLEGGGKELRRAEREQFQADLARLERGSAVVTLQAEPDGAWIIDERVPTEGNPILNRYGPSAGPVELRIRAGRHRIHAELSGYVSETWDFESRPGASGSHTFELRRANVPSETPPPARPEPFQDQLGGPDDRSTARVLGYGALGLGGAGVALGTLFLIQNYELEREGTAAFDNCAQQMPAPIPCVPAERKWDAEGVAETRSLVSFSIAGALLTTGILLLVHAGPPRKQQRDALALVPWAGPDQLGVAGRF